MNKEAGPQQMGPDPKSLYYTSKKESNSNPIDDSMGEKHLELGD